MVTPLRTYPVIRDLVTDVSINYARALGVPSFAPPDGLRSGEYRMAQFPAGTRAMAELEPAVHSAALELELLELLRIRASQINGYTYCLAMHNRDARSRGEHQTRLDTVAAWREAPYYTPRERAPLA